MIQSIYESIQQSFNDEENVRMSLLSDPNIIALLDLILLTNCEWLELERNCHHLSLHLKWLNGDLLWDAEKNCVLLEDSSLNQNKTLPFILSAMSTSRLMLKLLENDSNHGLNDEIEPIILSQLKHLLFAGSFVSIKCNGFNTNEYKEMSVILDDCLIKFVNKIATEKLTSKIVEMLLHL